MSFISTANPWAFVFGLLGNIVSFGVFLSPLPTFIRIVKKKSTDGFQSFPYIVALFSAMLWIYYALAKTNASLLITINSIGCVIEVLYIAIFVTYAPKKPRATAIKMIAFINFGVFGAILVLTQFLTKGDSRIKALGWICVALSASVFGAPLSIIKQVIRTKSVEFMPFWLSFSLLLSAICWLFYGIFLKDLYIAAPNILGFTFSLAQVILYAVYRKNKGPTKTVDDHFNMKLPETVHDDVLKPSDVAPPAAAVAIPHQPETTHNVNEAAVVAAAAVMVAAAATQPQSVVQVDNCGTEMAVAGGPAGTMPSLTKLTGVNEEYDQSSRGPAGSGQSVVLPMS